jgi:hypothetical protein
LKQANSLAVRKDADVVPSLGTVPVDLDMGSSAVAETGVLEGLRRLYEKAELCDLALKVGEEKLVCHRAVLASMSPPFLEYLVTQRHAAKDAASDPMGGLLVAPQVPETVVEGKTSPDSAVVSDLGGTASVADVSDANREAEVAPVPRATGDVQAPDVASTTPTCSNPPPEATEESDPQPSVPSITERVGGPDAPSTTVDDPPSASIQGCATETLELELAGVSSMESARIFLSYVYERAPGSSWEYRASSDQVNKDVLRLAQHFQLPYLREHAARWLARNLTTQNVVQRLVTCEEFGMTTLRDAMMSELVKNPATLAVVSSSSDIMEHPRILQELLLQVASNHRAEPVQKSSPEVSVKRQASDPNNLAADAEKARSSAQEYAASARATGKRVKKIGKL